MGFKREEVDVERSAFSIREFCVRNGMSDFKYYTMRAKGIGPREMRMDGLIRISADAERDWQRSRENPTGADAEAVEAQRARLKQRSERAIAGGAR